MIASDGGGPARPRLERDLHPLLTCSGRWQAWAHNSGFALDPGQSSTMCTEPKPLMAMPRRSSGACPVLGGAASASSP